MKNDSHHEPLNNLPSMSHETSKFEGGAWHVHSNRGFLEVRRTIWVDVFPIGNGDFPASHASFSGCSFREGKCSLALFNPLIAGT